MDLRDYATKMGEIIGDPVCKLLAERGEMFEFTPLPAGENPGRAKNCYGNATHRAILPMAGEADATYYEGLCHTGSDTIEHAWCVLDGQVLELTLRHNDQACPFCLGEGWLHPTDHWAYVQPDDDDDEYIDEAETIECEICHGSGYARPVDRSGTTYLGIPVDNDTLRAIIMAKGSYTCLEGAGFGMVLEMLGEEVR